MNTRSKEAGARLRAWRGGRTQEWLEEVTGIRQSLISKYETGEVTPLPPNAAKIERATDGEIRVGDWYDTDDCGSDAA